MWNMEKGIPKNMATSKSRIRWMQPGQDCHLWLPLQPKLIWIKIETDFNFRLLLRIRDNLNETKSWFDIKLPGTKN